MFNYQKLLGKMRERGFTQANLANAIGISETSLNLTLNNKREFRQAEILAACDALEIKLADIEEYFFSPAA